MIKEVIADTEKRMKKSIVALQASFATVRSGKANIQMLDGIKVDYYDTPTPLSQVGSISTPEARLLVIQPWEKSLVDEIVKAIQKSNLGLNPQSDGQLIRIPVPPLTEERRKELVKVVKKMAEDTKVAIRNIRRDANDQLKKAEKEKNISEDQEADGEDEVQRLTNEYIKQADDAATAKSEEVMEV